MPFSLDSFIKARDFLYHNTSRANLPWIANAMRLDSAEALLSKAGRGTEIHGRRPECAFLSETGPVLQSQGPLIAKNIAFADEWTMARLLLELNGLVFFWPGTELGPIKNGKGHSGSSTGPMDRVTLRIPTADAFGVRPPKFCRYNSGSPRYSQGRPSPRGQNLFLSASEFPSVPSDVVEVVFEDSLSLPESVRFFDEAQKAWKPLSFSLD